ncbi:universal stress protein [Pelagibacterium luteolum]|uniref:Universal stress protein n=1 Tax=Pelagibacterium luteolum TaxID=440168 RepID=A0A1G7WCX9_9HYPH|nr:universal stress protein [Pelagibacterium luteolum]SDG69826.1 Nucleotide-binding universal stress protein, UspA family [Pelagibacterium luteolum]
MYSHILIATDGSDLSRKGLDHGLKLAKQLGARVTIITVTDMWAASVLAEAGPATIADYEASQQVMVKEVLEEAARFATESGVAYETRHIPNRYPADAIVETAQKAACDLIVMASHGRRGFRKMLLGSQTNEVLTTSTMPVLVVK